MALVEAEANERVNKINRKFSELIKIDGNKMMYI